MTITVALIVYASSCLLELSIWFRPIWLARRWLSYVTLVWVVVATIILQLQLPLLAGLGLAILAVYRVINLGRAAEGRMQADYLYSVASRASVQLLIAQVLLVILVVIGRYVHLSSLTGYELLLGAQLVCAVVLVHTTSRNLRTTQPPQVSGEFRDSDLPTLTVAIPARNETVDLEACLQSLVASTYPKLEIIVLDDCSPNKRTPEIIRGFAHDGVRFMGGREVPLHWLAKNYAYYQLAEEANGELLLFCGVDARFEPGSLRTLVTTMLDKKKTMLSIIPKNTAATALHLEALLVQPNRYAWELAVPRRFINRPPVLSTCWLITAQALEASGGLPAASNSVNTERHFAQWCARHEDGYTFMQSDTSGGISTAKSFAEQRATAIRVRYPQLHRRLDLTAVVSVVEFIVLVLPFGFLVGALLAAAWGFAALSLLTCGLLTTMYVRIVRLTYRRFLYRGLWLLPYAALYDIALLNYSMWQYEFGTVVWKGRNVCIPVMRVIPRLADSPKQKTTAG
jgi:chlorobactene glucosyltransferase